MCLVADAVIREAKAGMLPKEFTDHAVKEGVEFCVRLGLGPELSEMCQKARKLKGGTDK